MKIDKRRELAYSPDVELRCCVWQNVKIIWLAVSLGGPETLMEHPATMSHGPTITGNEDCTEVVIADGLIRMRYVRVHYNLISLWFAT